MQLITAKQMAELLQVKKSRVYELVRIELIPCVRLGRQLRFDPKAIEQWITKGGSGKDKQSDQFLIPEQIEKEEKL